MAHSNHHILSSSEGEHAEMFEVTWGGGEAVLQFLLYIEFLSVVSAAKPDAVICLVIITSASPLRYKFYICRFYQAWTENTLKNNCNYIKHAWFLFSEQYSIKSIFISCISERVLVSILQNSWNNKCF